MTLKKLIATIVFSGKDLYNTTKNIGDDNYRIDFSTVELFTSDGKKYGNMKVDRTMHLVDDKYYTKNSTHFHTIDGNFSIDWLSINDKNLVPQNLPNYRCKINYGDGLFSDAEEVNFIFNNTDSQLIRIVEVYENIME